MSRLRTFANFLALLCVTAGTIYTIAGLIVPFSYKQIFYTYSFWSFIAAFLSIQLRIRAGGRVRRTPLFWSHLAASIPFLICLGVLSFSGYTQTLSLVATALGCVALGTGLAVFIRPKP